MCGTDVQCFGSEHFNLGELKEKMHRKYKSSGWKVTKECNFYMTPRQKAGLEILPQISVEMNGGGKADDDGRNSWFLKALYSVQ